MEPPDDRGFRVRLYKRATKSFLSWLEQVGGAALATVREIVRAVDAVASQQTPVPRHVMLDLEEAICLRKETMKVYQQHGESTTVSSNESHAHFVNTLIDCRERLKACVAVERRVKEGEKGHGNSDSSNAAIPVSNAFEKLKINPPKKDFAAGEEVRLVGLKGAKHFNGKLGRIVSGPGKDGRYVIDLSDGDGDEDAHRKSTTASQKRIKPENLQQRPGGADEKSQIDPAANTERWGAIVVHKDIADKPASELAEGGDVFFAMCFLVDLDDILHIAKDAWRQYKAKTMDLLTATMVTNLCVRSVSRLCAQMQILYPYLKSFDHVIAVVYLQPAIQFIMRTNKKKRVKYPRAVDAASRATFIRVNMESGLQDIQARGFGSDSELVVRAVLENYLGVLENMFAWPGSLLSLEDAVDLPWWSTTLHKFLDLINPKLMLRPKRGFFGEPWDEKTNMLAERVDDLRAFVFADVLPPLCLYSLDTFGTVEKIFAEALDLQVLMPLPGLLREGIKAKSAPIPLLFAILCLCQCILEVQGDRRVERTKLVATVSLKKLHAQLKKVHDNPHPSMQKSHVGNIRLGEEYFRKYFVFVEEFSPNKAASKGIDPSQLDDRVGDSVDNAMLNPWMAGQQLAFGTFLITMQIGCTIVDCAAQARIILHIYNALRTIGALKTPIPIFDLLLKALGKNLFPKIRPVKGAFFKAFLIAFGHNPQAASALSKIYLARGNKIRVPRDKEGRQLKPYDLKLISLAYRRACLFDFSDIRAEETKSGVGNSESIETIIKQINLAGRAVQNEMLIGINLVAIGDTLLHVMDKLLDDCGMRETFEADLRQIIEESHRIYRNSGRKKRRNKKNKTKNSHRNGNNEASEEKITGRNSDENNRRTGMIFSLQELLILCDRENVTGDDHDEDMKQNSTDIDDYVHPILVKAASSLEESAKRLLAPKTYNFKYF
mmetsp:Transcript_30804/g.75120  ORF Transcript_30804/g.75120 Transcript_30804/m.75120 type:complete len:945 (+) Transcript_30804:138-2972(+)